MIYLNQFIIFTLIFWLTVKFINLFQRFKKISKFKYFDPHPIFGDMKEIFFSLLGIDKASVNKITIETSTSRLSSANVKDIYTLWVFWYPVVLTLNPNIIEQLLKSAELLDKGNEYDFLHSWLGEGLLTSRGEKWRARRRMLTPSFHFRILNTFIPIMEKCSRDLVEHIRPLCGEKINLQQYLPLSTLNTICKTSMGVNMNALDEPESKYVRSIKYLNQTVFKRVISPSSWSDKVFYKTKQGKLYKQCLLNVHNFAIDVIRSRKADIEKEPDEIFNDDDESRENVYVSERRQKLSFLDMLIYQHLKSFNGKEYTFSENDIREEVDTFMFEAHDSTSCCLGWTMLILGNEKELQQRIYDELITIIGDDKSVEINETHLKQMKLLESTIKESLRLYPPVPFIVRRIPREIKLAEYEVPANMSFIVPIYHLHRKKELFPDPLRFNAERFLDERIGDRHPYAYIPFSAGSRNCIGQRFAFNEVKIFIANLMRNFLIEATKKVEHIDFSMELILRPDEVPVVLTERT